MDKPVTLEPVAVVDKKAEKERKKAELAAKRAAKKAGKEAAAGQVDVASLSLGDVSTPGSSAKLTSEQRRVAANRAVTGVLASMPAARDIKFASFSVSVGGRQLVADSNLELTQGCRYGLLGDNGSGKSNVLAAVAQREVPLPEHVSVYHLHEEAPPTELSGVEAVIEHVRAEVERLEAMSEAILEAVGPEDERLEAINDRLSELDPTGSEPRARKILSGLGFADHLVPMDRPTKHMSGGWRMRVALAQALFAAPELLLLDEPTNHLDLEACVWLEEHLASYPKCLLLVSHSQDFLNAVCTHTLWLSGRLLRLYGGNYAKFVQTVEEEERLQLKVYEKQQADIDKLSDFVRVNKANGVASSAKSKKKVLEKLETGAVEKPKLREPSLTFSFPECSRLAPPVLPFDDVSFAYPGSEPLYEALNFGVDCDSRIALVGPNGCGKSTLLKLMSGELSPTEGSVKKHQHCSLGLYHQHSTDVLDLDMAPLPFLRKVFPPSVVKHTEEWWRGYLATFGFSPEQQQSPMGMLSHGQRSRIVFAMLAMKDHTVLLLDEPTNHLDVDAVDGLAAAIKAFGGGVVLVSHDFRLIDQVADEIWLCEDRGVRRLEGSIHEYKKALAKKMSKHKVGLR